MTRTQLVAAFSTGVCALFVAGAEAQAAPNDQAPEAAPAEPAPPPAMAAPAPPMGAPVAPVGVATAPAPRKPAPNSIYAEGLGAGLAYSLNYERMVLDDLGVRLGFSYLSVSATATSGSASSSASASFLSFPMTVSYIGVRSGKHSLELGGGFTLTRSSGSASSIGMTSSGSGMSGLGTAMIGYRIHPVDRAGFNFRVGAMALAGKGLGFDSADPTAFGVLPWFYISMGASF
jgi:hypothetical protein